ncbi:MAG TPA: T9SS type A sorting domain-containing protein [Bacteroidia bacterium]|jgi:hypothetical protein|nr:T9SS type A sorting domain-containing protein [Bacteroidia bacterium]
MKNIFIMIFFLITFNVIGQITLLHTYDTASTAPCNISGLVAEDQLMMINFEVLGDQYVKINRHGKNISIYDMSHALVKTISWAALPTPVGYSVNYTNFLYFSQKLFNTDSKIEFMYTIPSPSSGGGTYYTGIYNEDGTLLFSDTGTVAIFPSVPLQQYPIYNTTSNGTIMILSYINGQAKVFGLAGTLTTAIDRTSHSFASTVGNAYPNPTNGNTIIEYNLPKNINQGEIVFYDLQGTEIKRFKVDRTFNSLLISTSDIPAGTYYYQLQTSGNTSAGKKMVVVK